MKNKTLCLVGLTAFIVFKSIFCNAQVVDNKVNIYPGYETGLFHGNESINDQNFIYPSLYPNFKNLSGGSLKILCRYSNYFSFGITLMHIQAHGWEYPDSMLYQGSKMIMQSLSPTVQMRTKLAETGALNRIRVFFEIAPGIGLSKLMLTNPLFDIYSENGQINQPMNSSDLFYGVKGSAGMELAITQNFGIYFSYSYSHNRVESKLYADNHFSSSCLSLGIVLKLRKVKQLF